MVLYKNISQSVTPEGYRIELRRYVVTTSWRPLRIYYSQSELAKVFFDNTTETDSSWKGPQGSFGVEVQRRGAGAWLGSSYFNMLRERGAETQMIKSTMNDCITKVLLGTAGPFSKILYQAPVMRNLYNTFNIWAFDFMLDQQFQPYLIEVNQHSAIGSFSKNSTLTTYPLLTNLLNLVGYHFPPTLQSNAEAINAIHDILTEKSSRHKVKQSVTFDPRLYTLQHTSEEIEKHKHFHNMSRSEYLEKILQNLLPSDVRELIRAEDELERARDASQGYVRLFPTAQTYR